MATAAKKAYRGMGMEGMLARWYARNTGKDLGEYQDFAATLARNLPEGGNVLEVAPGPGYAAIELAKLGPYRVVGLDISHTFVQMAAENAAKAGVDVTFRHGDASHMPFGENSFDLVACRAAFKNFSEPVLAIREMHRVLKPGGKAVIIDLRPDAAGGAIDAYVRGRGMGAVNGLLTKIILRRLTRRAYSREQFQRMASETPFKTCQVREEAMGFEIWFTK